MREIKQFDIGDHLTGTIGVSLAYLSGRTCYLNAIGTTTQTLISGPVSVDANTGSFDYTPTFGDYDIPDTYNVEIEAVKDSDETDRVTWPNGTPPQFKIVNDIANAPISDSMDVPVTVVNAATDDISGTPLGLLPSGMKVIAYLDDEPKVMDVVAADGTWALSLANGADYVLIGTKPGNDEWQRTVRV